MRAATRHTPLVATEARWGVVSHNSGNYSHNHRDGGNKFLFIVIIVIKADSDCGSYSHNRRDGGNKFIFIVIIVIKADSDCGNYSHNGRDGRNK